MICQAQVEKHPICNTNSPLVYLQGKAQSGNS